MHDEGSTQRQFLFVDDNPEFLAALTELLKEMSGGKWSIRTATNHSRALDQLKAKAVDTIVLDVEMPVMDGIEFLRLLGRKHPGQQVVMLSGRIDESARKTCLDLGATLYLEKPVSAQGFRSLYAALDSLAAAPPQSGFRGVIQRVGLEDVLQMECLARKSSLLEVSTGNRRGQIYICDGQIVHAQAGQLQGEMALYGLLALQGGEFALKPFAEPSRRTISGQYEFLLMEAARLRDEAGPRSPGQADGLERTADLGISSPETLSATEARGIQIQEVLLSSSAGEVLYQMKCQSIEDRLALFKSIEQEAAQASKGTPSGRFHRVTMETGDSRLLVQYQPGFKLLVRSGIPKHHPADE
jgi:CheY-like chemotaxis protein